jgi:hypothetical protein
MKEVESGTNRINTGGCRKMNRRWKEDAERFSRG